MQTITWTGEMELGLPDIDDAHRLLLDQFARTAGASDEDFHATFCTLVDAIEADFREEEALMEDIEDQALNAHRAEHARVLGALHHTESKVAAGETAVGRHCLELLPQWFLVHQSTMDMALAHAVRRAAVSS